MTNEEEYAKIMLESISKDFVVKKISESNTKTPDFILSNGEYNYLIELKTKYNDIKKEAEREKKLSQGDIYQEETPHSYSNVLSGIISDGSKQLSSMKEINYNFRLLCLLLLGHEPDMQAKKFEHTFYGTKYIIIHDERIEQKERLKECLYFYYSVFYRFRGIIDGAILLNPNEGCKLYMNGLSDKYELLKKTKLFSVLKNANAVYDPIELEKNQKVLVVDNFDNHNPRNESEVLEYIRNKYGIKYLQTQEINHFLLISKF
jgi:hypothetical protein